MAEPELTEIELPVCHNESDRPCFEVVEVERLGEQRYRLVHSPGVVEGLARGDVIDLCDCDPRGFTVVSRSGYLCVWFYFPQIGQNRGPDGERARAVVKQFGGICDGGGNTNLIFSVDVDLGFPAVERLFHDLVAQYPGSSWFFGNVYDPWNNFQPLGWWE